MYTGPMEYTTLKTLIFVFTLVWLTPAAYSADYYCEVMALKGSAFVTAEGFVKKPMAEGDLLKPGDFIEVEPASYVDLAYDKEWSNITRLGENSQMTIKSIYPTGLMLDKGDVFSKLQKLPRGTTFEIQTPTAVAAVRGTEFFTSVDARGKTDIVSFEHQVEVFSLDSNGNLGRSVIVNESQRTEVGAVNEPPRAPEKAAEADMVKIRQMNTEVEQNAKENIDKGIEGHTQLVASVEAFKTMESYLAKGENRPAEDPNKKDTDAKNYPGGDAARQFTPADEEKAKEIFKQLGGNPADFKAGNMAENFRNMDPMKMEDMDKQMRAGNMPMMPSARGDMMPMREPTAGAVMPDRFTSPMENRMPFAMGPGGEFVPRNIGNIDQKVESTMSSADADRMRKCAEDPACREKMASSTTSGSSH